MHIQQRRKPDWLKINLPKGENYLKVHALVKEHGLHTICTSGKCPNIGECWALGTATFMILGDVCTRTCKFCNVGNGKPLPVDLNEPLKLANSVKIMGLKHVVLTSVTRDDLPDGGANHWALVILKIKEINPGTTIETLIPDFNLHYSQLDTVIQSRPEVISHNLETVERLTTQIRSKAQYRRSLEVIKYINSSGITAKSGIMVGLGETVEEVLQTMDDLLAVGCKIMTIGQYLQPTQTHLPVVEYITPEQFEFYRVKGLEKGFRFVESAPLVRSSYHAEKQI